MATVVRLVTGDGTGPTDYIDLDSGVLSFVSGSLNAPTPRAGERYRAISWTTEIRGAGSIAIVEANISAIETKFAQARAAAGPYGHGTRVTLTMQLGDGAMRYADVIDGVIDVVPVTYMPPYIEGGIAFVQCSVLALPYLRGDAVTTTVSTTITATAGTYAVPGGSGSGGLFVADIPGDVPALVAHVIEDVSTTSKYINKLRIGAFSLRDPAAAIAQTAYTPWIDDTPYSPGAAYADATAVGGSCARVSLTTGIQTLARYPKPAAAYVTGLFDVFARVRDSNTVLGAPTLTALGVDNDANMYVRQTLTASSASADHLSPTWGTTTKAGSCLLMAVMLRSRTITITTPTGWSASTAAVAHASGACRVAWFYIENSAARSGVETVTISSADSVSAVMFEVVGAVIGGAGIDVEVTSTATGAGSAAISSGALAQAREMVFACAQVAASASGWEAADISGFTDITAAYHDNTQDASVSYARSVSTTTQSFTFNHTTSSDYAEALIAVKQGPNLAPNIPTGTYEICVVACSAGGATLSLPSQSTTVVVTQTDCVIYAEWNLGAGSPDHHRLYYRLAAGTWEYYATAASSGTYTAYIIADDAGTVGDPPNTQNVTSVYCLFATSDVAQTFFTKPVPTMIGNGVWEWLHLGMVPLPPIPAADGAAPRDWIFSVDATNSVGTGTFDADVCVLMQHPIPSANDRSYVEARPGSDTDIAALRRWNIGTNRYGETYAYVSETGTDTAARQLIPVGESLGGPGDVWFTILPDIQNSVSEIVDAKLTWQIVYTPRYIRLGT